MKTRLQKSVEINKRHCELMKKRPKKPNVRCIDFNVTQDVKFLNNALKYDKKVENALFSANTGLEFRQILFALDNRYDLSISVANEFFNEFFKLNADFNNEINSIDFDL